MQRNIILIIMKKSLFGIIFSLSLLFTMSANAQFIKQMQLLTPHYYPGIVYFKDGHSEEFYELELPRVGKGKLEVKKSADEKNRADIDAADIVGIKIWHRNYPDKAAVLYYVHIKKELMQDEHQWGRPVAGSSWGMLFLCDKNYEINKKTGEFYAMKQVDEYNCTNSLYFLKAEKWDEARLLVLDNISAFNTKHEKHKLSFALGKKKAAELFKENSKIYEGIKSGAITADDIQYILDEMAGGKKAETPAQNIPQVQTDSVSNGQVGDDE